MKKLGAILLLVSIANISFSQSSSLIAQYVKISTNPPCYVARTGWTNTIQVGDDGYYQAGLANPNPRFTVLDNTNCVRDNLTGLIWARNANLFSGTWTNAAIFCDTLDYGGQTDWRMPNIVEMESLRAFQYSDPVICDTVGTGKMTENNPFVGVNHVLSDVYFSGTWRQVAGFQLSLTMSWEYGLISSGDPTTSFRCYVWPVRGP